MKLEASNEYKGTSHFQATASSAKIGLREITRVGADLAKSVIQIHALDAAGKPVTNRALVRDKFVIWCAQLR